MDLSLMRVNAVKFVVAILEGWGDVYVKLEGKWVCYKTKILLLKSCDMCQEVWEECWGLCILQGMEKWHLHYEDVHWTRVVVGKEK